MNKVEKKRTVIHRKTYTSAVGGGGAVGGGAVGEGGGL